MSRAMKQAKQRSLARARKRQRRRTEAGSRRYQDVDAEPDVKKIARAFMWQRQVQYRQQMLGMPIEQQRFLALASAEAGDVSALLGLGVRPENIVGVDINPEACAMARAKFPGVAIHCGDVAELAPQLGRFDCAALDFCSTAMGTDWRSVARVISFCSKHLSVFAIGLMRGRERGRTADFIREMATIAAEEYGQSDRKMAMRVGRVFAFDMMVWGAVRRVKDRQLAIIPVGSISYKSRVPMMYREYKIVENKRGWSRERFEHSVMCEWAEERMGMSYPASLEVDSHASVRDVAMLKPTGVVDLAKLFNVSPRSMAAWKAWNTRRKQTDVPEQR